ncbi:hypothetical protein AAC387_Pa07g0404 [Persea americana]
MAKGSKLKPDNKLMYEQDSHVSKAILNGVETGAYRCINTNPDKDIWELTDRQKEIVRDVGLVNISEIDYMRIDHALISGLVERWRPETNTFHLPTDEAMVTLEDVAYIYIWAPNRRARGSAWQLELFREFKSYTWGLASLASLYRMLGRVTMLLKGEEVSKETEEGEDKRETSKMPLLKTLIGPLQLLQIWAYSRMSIGRCPTQSPDWKKDLQLILLHGRQLFQRPD